MYVQVYLPLFRPIRIHQNIALYFALSGGPWKRQRLLAKRLLAKRILLATWMKVTWMKVMLSLEQKLQPKSARRQIKNPNHRRLLYQWVGANALKLTNIRNVDQHS
jgi:hypothetical protein